MSIEKYSHEISLLHDALKTKAVGIVDIYGYVSTEFGDPVFKITRIILNTGTAIYVEGEHDLPYLCHDTNLFTYPENEGDQ